jgi:ABC-type multidrug transport system permease subunit
VNGLLAVMSKEFSHIRRQPSTLFFALLVPAIQLAIFGYAANTTIERIPLAVFDLDRRQDARELQDALVNTRAFDIVEHVNSREQLERAVRSGRARAVLVIPPDYSERLLGRQRATVQLQIDGSDAQVATTALNSASLLVQNLSLSRLSGTGRPPLARDESGHAALPQELRPRVLFNPDLEDTYFYVPGLTAIILQMVLSFLTAFSIAREREMGTLEQLFVTPVSAGGLLIGKLAPYALLSVFELLVVLTVMTVVFAVPINGSLLLVAAASALFIVTALALGLMISTIARSQLSAMQLTFLIMLPSVLLSGFVFPRSEMPLPLYVLSSVLPATYIVQVYRAVIVRGADLWDVLPALGGLLACLAVVVTVSLVRFRKTLD